MLITFVLPLQLLLSQCCEVHGLAHRVETRQLKHVPKLTEKGQRFDIKSIVFEGYMSSQELCEDLYQLSWTKERKRRIFLPRSMYESSADQHKWEDLLRNLPPANEQNLPPVQSIFARYGLGVLSRQIDRRYRNTPECTTGCEDTKIVVELWLAAKLVGRQKRSQGPFRMRCPPGFRANLIFAPDLREWETEHTKMLLAKVLTLDDYYDGEKSHTSILPHYQDDGPLSQCECIPADIPADEPDPEVQEVEKIEEDEIVQPLVCLDLTDIGIRDIGEQREANPYAEGAEDLDRAYTQWSNLYPDRTFRSAYVSSTLTSMEGYW